MWQGSTACPAQLRCVLAQCGTWNILHFTGAPLGWDHMVCPYPSLCIPCWSYPKETIPLCVSQAAFNLLAQSQSRGSEVRGLRETHMNRDHQHREVAARDADLQQPNPVIPCASSCRRLLSCLTWPWEWSGVQQVPWQEQEAPEIHLWWLLVGQCLLAGGI